MNFTAERWVGKSCTIDGKPAKIMGRLLHFGLVYAINYPISSEFSWDTIEKVMTTLGGKFKS